MSDRGLRIVIAVFFLVVMGFAALYAYDQKAPQAQNVAVDDVSREIQQGAVKSITVSLDSNNAAVELRDGTKQQAIVMDRTAESLRREVETYNAGKPDGDRIRFEYRREAPTLQWLWQLLVAVLPIVFIAGVLVYLLSGRSRGVTSGGARAVSTGRAPKAIGPYAQAIASGELVFCSGQVALDPQSGQLLAGGIREQTKRVLGNLSAVLEASGSDLAHVVKTTVYLTDLADFNEMNAEYGVAFGSHTPARATVQVAGLPRGARVEIECIAIRSR